jgi:hypothetical protein
VVGGEVLAARDGVYGAGEDLVRHRGESLAGPGMRTGRRPMD